MAGFMDDLLPFLQGVILFQEIHIHAMGAQFPQRKVIEVEDIGNQLFFLRRDPPAVHHQQDFLFACLFLLLVGVNAHEPQHGIGADRQQPHQGPEDNGDPLQESGHGQGQRFAFAHGQALGNQFAEDQREIGQDQCDHND